MTKEDLGSVGYQVVFGVLDELENISPGISLRVIETVMKNNRDVLKNGPNQNAEAALEILQHHLETTKKNYNRQP